MGKYFGTDGFNIIISIGSQPHEISSAAFALYHIGNSFHIKLRLGEHSDHKSAILMRLIVPCFSSPAA